ncbi:hypothetical protein NDU88_005097 [Pleurodeles waltl]|uniref:Glutathione S-transferase C-terminal domain-containing protein n=2 Tax=Pleurodeles waltl TaxID=8319 RepID=A0AAV7WTS4_PLEWA|nr:hypothetical protein NDU88_005097 [Pleurodeles waltl]
MDHQLASLKLPKNLEFTIISRGELPLVAQNCRLPAMVENHSNFCRAGLAVVLRHIIKKACEEDPAKKDVSELLGFKNTCLKACAEVSQWTRLCEISIPNAVERFLKGEGAIPLEILQLEKKLGEPVRVHNDDKIRRQKLKQQAKRGNTGALNPHQGTGQSVSPKGGAQADNQGLMGASLELSAALSKLTNQDAPPESSREPSHIRKATFADLPALEHVFAEGMYFTLTDVVLLPCIHQFLVSVNTREKEKLLELPLLLCWYRRVQEVPGVLRAAAQCGMKFITFPELLSPERELLQPSMAESEMSKEVVDRNFIGGPRPTMTKLKESGIEACFSPQSSPSRTIDWENLPAAVSPAEGKMSGDRALRKKQQLDNLVSAVINLVKPGDVAVDFCSGGGHVGLVLAHMLPSCQVVLIENKEESLVRAKDRSIDLGLKNIWFIQANLDYFTGGFNIGVALHACGVATDMVIEHCITARAAFVVCPCCYGFIQNTVKATFPRSHRFKEVLSYKEHMILCRFADQTAAQLPPERRLIGKRCMGLVDMDRAWAAEACGYSAQVISMEPETCSPKNNMIVGVPL